MCAYFTSDPFLKETLMENLKSPSKTRKHSKLGNAQTTNGQKWQMTISVWFSIQTYRSVQTTFWAPLSCHMLESLNRKMGKLKKPHPKILTRKLCEFVWEIREIVSKLERKTRTLSDLIGSILVNFRPFLKPLQIDSFNMSYSRAAKTLIKISLQTIYLMKTQKKAKKCLNFPVEYTYNLQEKFQWPSMKTKIYLSTGPTHHHRLKV